MTHFHKQSSQETGVPSASIIEDADVLAINLSMESDEALETLLTVSSENSKQEGLPASVNATAYRIFKLLVWLNEGPLSVDALNQRFIDDAGIGKTLSSDSIWLYINTLKALGCDIRRPTRTNGFQYELKHHPFGIHLDHHHLSLLVELKRSLEKQGLQDEVLAFDRFLKKVISHSSLPEREQFGHLLFQHARSVDYESGHGVIEEIRQAIQRQQLLSILYLSPMKGKETLFFLPDDVLYQNGALYVLGYQSGRTEGSMLRVDRIERVDVIVRPETLKKLLRQREQEQRIHFRFLNVLPDAVPQFGMNEVLTPIQQANPENPEQMIPCVDVTLETRHFFLLRQKILESGLLFCIFSPAEFSENVLSSLRQMRQLYAFDNEGSAGC